jgi:cysteine desulfurase / selenocysteine lyase
MAELEMVGNGKSLQGIDTSPLIENSEVVYLDSSATSQKPKQVIEAINEFYEKSNANVHRGIYDLSVEATQMYDQSRRKVANFINAQFEEIIFTRGTTDGLNLLASSLGKNLVQGDEIVLTEMEHHSNLVPWQQLAKEKNLILKFIPITESGELDLVKAKELITSKTKILSVIHVSNVLGTINPINELAEIIHAAGGVIIVDAAQSVPHMPIDVKQLNCDFLTFSSHKMAGPTGVGVLYGRKELLEKMSPYQYGGDMITFVSLKEAKWNDLPYKFEAGTPNVAGVIGLGAAVDYLQRLGMNEIKQHSQDLVQYAVSELSKLPGLQILGPVNRGPLVSFVMENAHPHDISEICNRYHIAVRAGHHCAMPLHQKLGLKGSVRASFYFYNSRGDVDKLITALQEVRRIF